MFSYLGLFGHSSGIVRVVRIVLDGSTCSSGSTTLKFLCDTRENSSWCPYRPLARNHKISQLLASTSLTHAIGVGCLGKC